MDDNAGGYYDQHVYITHRIANMVRAIIRQRTCNTFGIFNKNSTIFSIFCLITQNWARRQIILYVDW